MWDSQLTADAWRWLEDQFIHMGTGQGSEPWPIDAADGAEMRQLAGAIVAVAKGVRARPLHLRSAVL